MLMLGGYFAHRGYPDLGGVIATAFVAAQGLRIALPVALGLTSMDARKFFWLNLLSAAVWSCVFVAAMARNTPRCRLICVISSLRRFDLH